VTPEALAHIHALCFTSPRPWTAQEFVDLRLSRASLFVERPCGFLVGNVSADEAEVLTLAVHPDHRREGIGAQLLRGFEEIASERGAVRFVLEVSVGNPAAIALYTAKGYKPAGYRKDYYAAPGGEKSSAIVMVKEENHA